MIISLFMFVFLVLSSANQTRNHLIFVFPQARIKLLSKTPETVVEPCLSCGRQDQPERFHTHPSREKERDVRNSSHKSPLKENRQNTKEREKKKTDRDDPGHLKDKQRQRRSQSPKKSLSPEKSISPTETSETQSPQVDILLENPFPKD